MSSVTCSPKMFDKNPPYIVNLLSAKIEEALYDKTFRAKRKGLVIIEAFGIRYRVIYHKHNEEIKLIEADQLKERKQTMSRKKNARLRR